MKSSRVRKAKQDHARQRARQRFNHKLTLEEAMSLVRQIQGGQATFVERTSTRATVWLVTLLSGQKAVAVYDNKKKVINTLMRPNKRWGYEEGDSTEDTKGTYIPR